MCCFCSFAACLAISDIQPAHRQHSREAQNVIFRKRGSRGSATRSRKKQEFHPENRIISKCLFSTFAVSCLLKGLSNHRIQKLRKIGKFGKGVESGRSTCLRERCEGSLGLLLSCHIFIVAGSVIFFRFKLNQHSMVTGFPSFHSIWLLSSTHRTRWWIHLQTSQNLLEDQTTFLRAVVYCNVCKHTY